MIRRYNIFGNMNTRDLGGYPTQFGEYTKYARFIRSDVPGSLKKADLDMFFELGITTSIDLRSAREAERSPSSFASDDRFEYFHCHLFGKAALPSREDGVAASYLELLDNHEAVKKIMRHILSAPGGVIFNCTAGKDRTGVITFLLLSIADVYEEDIIADYQVSATYLQSIVEALNFDNPDISAWVGRSRPKYMNELILLFKEKYGSAKNYMLALGFSEEEISNIRAKLV